MPTQSTSESWERLKELADARDRAGLDAYVSELEPTEAIRAILRLDESYQDAVLTTLSAPEAADLIEDMPNEQAADLIEHLAPADAASIVAEMQSDEQADLIADLEASDAKAILDELSPTVATGVRELARYPDDVAGGLMATEFVSVGEQASVGKTLDDLRERAALISDHFTRYVYVVSATRRVVGVAAVSEMALAPHDTAVSDVMVPGLFKKADAPLEELRDFFEAHPIAAVPIVDDRGLLLGVVRRTAVLDALAERAEREMLRMQGIVGGDELRSLPTLTRSRRRLSWLSINIVLNIAAASIIALYIDTLDAVIALAVFLPIISDMSGASGNQAVAVSLRELSLGLVRPSEVARVWFKEISVGALNGLALGVLLGVVAFVWAGNAYLGLVVGFTLTLNTLISVSVGGTVPLFLKRFGVDPAVASGPILTTVTDICGFLLALGLATLLLERLA